MSPRPASCHSIARLPALCAGAQCDHHPSGLMPWNTGIRCTGHRTIFNHMISSTYATCSHLDQHLALTWTGHWTSGGLEVAAFLLDHYGLHFFGDGGGL